MKNVAALTVLVLVLLASGQSLYAAPALQLYIEGGAYDEATQTWVMAPPGSSGGAPFRLWAVGNVDGPGARGVIENVRLAVAYDKDDLGLVIRLKPVQVGGLGAGSFHGFLDPSVPVVPLRNTNVLTTFGLVSTGPDGVVTGGARPLLGDGTPVVARDAFGPDTVWQEFSLGDFVLTDSPVGDFSGGFPAGLALEAGQINVYEVSVVGGSRAKLHFQLYGTTGGPAKIAACASRPNVEVFLAPEPAAFFVWGLLGLTFAGSAWMYQYLSRWRELRAQELALALVPAASSARPADGAPGEPSPSASGGPHSLGHPTWDDGISP